MNKLYLVAGTNNPVYPGKHYAGKHGGMFPANCKWSAMADWEQFRLWTTHDKDEAGYFAAELNRAWKERTQGGMTWVVEDAQ